METLNWYVKPGIKEVPKINRVCRLYPICGSVYNDMSVIEPVDSSQLQLYFSVSNTASMSSGILGSRFCAVLIFLMVTVGTGSPVTNDVRHAALATSFLFWKTISAVKMTTIFLSKVLAGTSSAGFEKEVLKVIGTPWALRHF